MLRAGSLIFNLQASCGRWLYLKETLLQDKVVSFHRIRTTKQSGTTRFFIKFAD